MHANIITWARRLVAASALLGLGQGVGAEPLSAGSLEGIQVLSRDTLMGAASSGSPTDNVGSSLYHPSFPQHGGVVELRVDLGAGKFGTCSGTLLTDRMSVLTAAHCANLGPTTLYFQPQAGVAPGGRLQIDGVAADGVHVRHAVEFFVPQSYVGGRDDSDIAVVRLDAPAPDWVPSYALNADPNLLGRQFNAAGYGGRGDGFGPSGWGLGYLRQGENRFDYRLGDPIFGTAWSTILGRPYGQIDDLWIADFDSGLPQNDAACILAAIIVGQFLGPACDLGLGVREAGIDGGDSGGPVFIDGMISAVSQGGLSYTSRLGDVDDQNNGSFGEFGVFTPIYLHADFIRSVMFVPEPGVLALLLLSAGLASWATRLGRGRRLAR